MTEASAYAGTEDDPVCPTVADAPVVTRSRCAECMKPLRSRGLPTFKSPGVPGPPPHHEDEVPLVDRLHAGAR
jgi:hypothetical protein